MKRNTAPLNILIFIFILTAAVCFHTESRALDWDVQKVWHFPALDEYGSYRVLVSGDRLYYDGLIFDVADAAHPCGLGRYYGTALAASGDVLYVLRERLFGDGATGLAILDIKDPANPSHIGSYRPGGERLSQNQRLAVSGGHLYWVSPEAGLEVISVTDPGNPRRISGFGIADRGSGIVISNQLAYITTEGIKQGETNLIGSGLLVVDISDPANPRKVGSCEVIGSAVGMAVADGYAYVAARYGPATDGGLSVIDVQDPAKPKVVGRYEIGGAESVAVSGNTVYLAAYGSLRILDVAARASPTLTGSSSYLAGEGVSMGDAALVGGHIYVGGPGLNVFKLAPANPQRLASLQFGQGFTNSTIVFPAAMAVSGNLTCVAYDNAGVQLFDISDPINPRRVGGYGSRGEFSGVAISGDYAYVSGTLWNGSNIVGNGLHVFDITDPINLQRLGDYSFPGIFGGLTISGRYGYLPGYSYSQGAGVWIFDLSNPTAPGLAAVYRPLRFPARVVVSGQHAYITTYVGSYTHPNFPGGAGLEIVDVSDPLSPRRVGAYDSGRQARELAISGHYAFVMEAEPLTYETGLAVIDIADPANPRRVGELRGVASDVAAWGNYVYIASYRGGLEAIDVSDPTNPRIVGRNSVFNPPNEVLRITASNGRVFVAAAQNGVAILDQFRPFRLEPLPGIDSGAFRFGLDGPRGVRVHVQRSSNLKEWQDWHSVTVGDGAIEISDSDVAHAARRFYRAIIP